MTKQQRKEIYWAAMFEQLFNDCNGLCWALTECSGMDAYDEEMRKHFPEVWEQKPSKKSGYWFAEGDTNPRLKILSRAIDLCESKTK